MFELPCPTCGKRVQGDDSYAGKLVVCPACNATMTLPQPSGTTIVPIGRLPYVSTEGAFSEGTPPPEPAPLSVEKAAPHIALRLLPYVILFGIPVFGAMLLIPAILKTRGAAERTQSVSNLKQIGMGMLSFEAVHKRLPINGTVAAVAGDPTSGSWAFQILPYVDQLEFFHKPNANSVVPTYLCPGRGRPKVSKTGAWTDYCFNPWLNDPKNGAGNAPDRQFPLLGITDGTSNTILCGHGMIDPNFYHSHVAIPQSTDIFKGGAAALARRSTTNKRDNSGDSSLFWGGPFSQGGIFVWCDCTVRMVPYEHTGGVITNGVSADPPGAPPVLGRHVGLFGAFLTPTGGEAVILPD